MNFDDSLRHNRRAEDLSDFFHQNVRVALTV